MASNGIPFTRATARGILLPVGFRFHPTEEELIGHYLQLKLRGKDSLVSDVIREINICNHEPWDLPAMSLIKSDDEEWYFYNRPIYKKNGRNDTERATSTGFWKITGRDKIVTARDNKTIGKKRILTFYRGRGRNAQITPWVMHEFYIPQFSPNANQRDFVLCHVKKKSGKNTDVATFDEGESSNYSNAPDFENQPHNMGVEEEHNQPPQNLDMFQWHMGSLLPDAHVNNDYHGTQSAPGANERDENSDEKFADSLIVDPDEDSSEQTTRVNVSNDSTLPESPWKVYLEESGIYNNAPDFENQPQPAHTMDVEEEHNLCFVVWEMGSLLADAHVNNDYHGTQSAPGANESDGDSEEFADTATVDSYEDSSEQITHVNVLNDSTQPESPWKVYLEDSGVSSGSATEVQHAVELEEAASSTNVLPKPQTDRLQSVSDEDSGASRPIKKSASSVDVDANSLQINQLAYDEYYNNERTRRRTYPTSVLIALGKPNELEQQQRKAKVAAERRAAVDFPPRRNIITESNKDVEAVQGNNTEKGLKQTHNVTTAGNWMSCSFISWETSPPLTSPPSVYLFNTVLGAILFFVFAREVVLYG